MEPVCNFTEPRTDFCEISGDIRVDPKSSTVFFATSQASILAENSTSWSIRPYARKTDKTAMNIVREWSIKPAPREIPQCSQYHNVPAILFSIGGYGGNHFHAFTDIIIPLFLTSQQFNGEVQFLISNSYPSWTTKFQSILKGLSRYDFINIDREEEIHCFPSLIIGLKSHKEMGIDSSRSPYSMTDFRQFLRSSYSLKKATAIKMSDGDKRKPRLLIISRRRTRAFTNSGEIVRMAKGMGYKVLVAEPDANLTRVSQVVNSCDVLLGVHGAGLTNMVFLPENAILIQILPIGKFDWLARTDFGGPAKDMNIRYLDYEIQQEESTLIQQYPLDHAVFRDPSVISKQGWEAWKSVYLEQQNVKIDVNRFRPTLSKALELLHE
ncbi:alpha-1,3-arabinosyltransferase XAT2-like [Tripterygium wilfordii]|nr:alpha-1,3-arabinosyltransferase XAT2-like [Tripterygium wilfordii]